MPPDHLETYSYGNSPRSDSPREFEGLDEAVELADDEGWLFGPFLELKIDELAVLEVFEPPSAPPYRATEGHELLAAYFSQDSIFSSFSSMGDERELDVTVSVVVEGAGTRLEGPQLAKHLIIVSVPEGEDALLEVVAEGRSQSISLRTGEPVATSEGRYMPAAHQVSYRYEGTGQLLDELNMLEPSVDDETVGLAIEWVARTPWLPDRGYAAEGRAWLIAGPNSFGPSPGGGAILDSSNDIFFNLRAGEAFVLVDGVGAETPAEPFVIQQVQLGGGGILVFDVPADFVAGTMQVTPGPATVWLHGPLNPEPIQWGRSWETEPPGDSFEIDLVEGTTAPNDVYDTEAATHYVYG